MASQNRLVVEVVGDTSKLTKSLNTAQQQINRFAGTSKIKSTAADGLLADVRGLKTQADELGQKAREVDERTSAMNASFQRTGATALIAGVAINTLGRNFAEAGGEIGRFGNALSQLSTGNFVGFVKAARDNTAALSAFGKELVATGDAAKAMAFANAAAAQGFDQVARAAKDASSAIRAAQDVFVDPTKTRDPISPGALAEQTSSIASKAAERRKGITQSQRNAFFDNDITRALDRAQDGELRDQVTKLKAVEQTLRDRLKVTKDITRQLRLEDEIVGVQRQQRSIEDTIAANAKARTEAAARAAEALRREQQERAKALEEARKAAIQSKQFRALGFAADGSEVVPGADNLRKQLATLTDRLGSSSVNLSSKLESQLEGVRKVLSGKFGQVTRESRDRIQQLFDTIRKEFDKGDIDGPLTKTTALNTNKILEGLGLSPASERELRARLSSFNSGGKALAGGGVGAFGQPVIQHTTNLIVDGQKLATNTTRHQQTAAKANPPQKRGR